MGVKIKNGVFISATSIGGILHRDWFVVDTTLSSPIPYVSSHRDAILLDSSNGSFTIKLPPSPKVNDNVCVAPLYPTLSTSPVTISGNGENILNSSNDVLLDENNRSLEFTYIGGSIGWAIIDKGQTTIISNGANNSASGQKLLLSITDANSGTFNIGGLLPANTIVLGCKIQVDQEFSGGTPTLQIGSANPGKEDAVSKVTDSTLLVSGLNENSCFFRVGTNAIDRQIVGELVNGTGTFAATILIEYTTA